MTKNITMTVDEDLLKKTKKIAIDKNTTITAMIRKHLEYISAQEDTRKKLVVSELRSIFENSNAVIGKKKWAREYLHAR